MEAAGDAEEVVEGGGLLGGLTAWHLRMLCENPWEGGGGYAIEEVGRMTLDQIWFRLCDKDVFKKGSGGMIEKLATGEAMGRLKHGDDGLVAGRAADGTLIRARLRGRSLAQELTERQEEEAAKEKRRAKRKRNRRR